MNSPPVGVTAISVSSRPSGPAGSGAAPVLTEILSTPTHSSEPPALAVMMRISTCDWFSAVTGSRAETLVTCVALPPVEASAVKAAGRLM